MNQLPSLRPIFGLAALNASGTVVNTIGAIVPGGPIPDYVSMLMACICGTCLYWQKSAYKNLIKRRNEIRKQNYKRWLNAPLAPAPAEFSWDDMERAIEALVAADVEPTIERANSWLKHEEERAKYIENYRASMGRDDPLREEKRSQRLASQNPFLRRMRGMSDKDLDELSFQIQQTSERFSSVYRTPDSMYYWDGTSYQRFDS